jgi:hypothetical protein
MKEKWFLFIPHPCWTWPRRPARRGANRHERTGTFQPGEPGSTSHPITRLPITKRRPANQKSPTFRGDGPPQELRLALLVLARRPAARARLQAAGQVFPGCRLPLQVPGGSDGFLKYQQQTVVRRLGLPTPRRGGLLR